MQSVREAQINKNRKSNVEKTLNYLWPVDRQWWRKGQLSQAVQALQWFRKIRESAWFKRQDFWDNGFSTEEPISGAFLRKDSASIPIVFWKAADTLDRKLPQLV